MRSYISLKVEKQKSSTDGKGLFATDKIYEGELVIDFTSELGKVLTAEEASRLYVQGNDYILQIGDNLFLAATDASKLEDSDFLNHSCSPNCGIRGNLQVVAMRDIDRGEEITIDYAMCESSKYYSMECKCGSDFCRKVITGEDWKQFDLQTMYRGFFSAYLQNKINSGNFGSQTSKV